MGKPFRKEAINLLLQQTPVLLDHFGDLVSPFLFKEGQMALLIDKSIRQCQLLFSQEIGFKQAFLRFSDGLATVSELESKGLIFIQKEEHWADLSLFYVNKVDFNKKQVPDEYSVNETVSLVYKKSNPALLSDTSSLYGVLLPDSMYDSIDRVFASRIYPTKELEDYASRNYRTAEQQIAHRSLVAAWVAIVVAIIIGVLPALMDLLKQSHG